MHVVCSFTAFIARLCLSAIFISAGFGKLLDYEATAVYMASKEMTMIPLFLYTAALIEILAGLALLLGYKTRYAAGILALFLIPATLIFHDFWNASGGDRHLQMIMFFKNLAIFGGLLYAVNCGPGSWSCDSCCCKKNPEKKAV
jgi:putative oxidoreductase